jgi:hypothetical protein
MTIPNESQVQDLIEVFTDSTEWWTPMGEYYAPGDGGETYDSLVRRFFDALGVEPPDKLLEKVKDL